MKLKPLIMVMTILCLPNVQADTFNQSQVEKSPVISILEKRQFGVVMQEWELSCAAGALATLLRYQHEEPVTEHSVALGMINRKEYLENPDLVKIRQGFSLLDMQRYTNSIGLDGHGLGQLTFDDLLELAPMIVPVNLQGYPHFVVFRGATKNSVLLADPAFGNLTLSKKRFSQAWIDYRDFGNVGFVVKKAGEKVPPGQLKATAMQFIAFR